MPNKTSVWMTAALIVLTALSLSSCSTIYHAAKDGVVR